MALASPWGSPPDWRVVAYDSAPYRSRPHCWERFSSIFPETQKAAGPVCPENRFGRGVRPEHFAAVRL